jgi:hypothetical protein
VWISVAQSAVVWVERWITPLANPPYVLNSDRIVYAPDNQAKLCILTGRIIGLVHE